MMLAETLPQGVVYVSERTDSSYYDQDYGQAQEDHNRFEAEQRDAWLQSLQDAREERERYRDGYSGA